MLFVPKNDTMWVLFLAVLVIFTRAPQLVVSSRASMSSLRSISDLFGHKVVNQLQLYVSTMIFSVVLSQCQTHVNVVGKKKET